MDLEERLAVGRRELLDGFRPGMLTEFVSDQRRITAGDPEQRNGSVLQRDGPFELDLDVRNVFQNAAERERACGER